MYTEHVALPAFAALTLAGPQSIDISYPPGPQQQTRHTLLQWVNGRDRWTGRQMEADGRTL